MLLLLVLLPIAVALRWSTWAVSVLSHRLFNILLPWLPVAPVTRPPVACAGLRVAVIGGGIAGAGCSYALQQSGAHVTLFEARDTLGGNAKTWDWASGRQTVRTGLSVLAWPPHYFHNYGSLLGALGIGTTTVKLPFAVRMPGSHTYLQDVSGSDPKFAGQIKAWMRAVMVVRAVESVFRLASRLGAVLLWAFTCGRCGGRWRPTSTAPCVYTFYFLNPLNIIPLRTLCWCLGMSRWFWDGVAMPIWSSTFLSARLDTIPASIAPVLQDIMPLAGTVELDTWATDSSRVFAALTAGVDVRVGTRVTGLAHTPSNTLSVMATTQSATTVQLFDRVVFACDAATACDILGSASAHTFWFERQILGGVTFSESRDPTFLKGAIHSDGCVLPADLRCDLLARYSNFVDVRRDGSGGGHTIENTFIISSWYPAAARCDPKPPMLVTYNLRQGTEGVRAGQGVLGEVSNARAHPELSPNNQVRALSLRFVQGRKGVYYCASSATLANGHDLSLLSGLVVASALGATYPFGNNPAALRDFEMLRGLMGL